MSQPLNKSSILQQKEQMNQYSIQIRSEKRQKLIKNHRIKILQKCLQFDQFKVDFLQKISPE